jgi:hypothetical protein
MPKRIHPTLEVAGRRSYIFRGRKVMLGADLASLYRVPTFRLNQAVQRNRERFPTDFMFQLTVEETVSLSAQFAAANTGRNGRYTLPLAFTDLGVAMLSTVLKSERAVQVNLAILRELEGVGLADIERRGIASQTGQLKRFARTA